MTLVNVVDNRSGRDVRAILAAAALAYPRLWMLGQRVGNTIVAGTTATHLTDRRSRRGAPRRRAAGLLRRTG